MACFDRASPALKEILLKLHRAENPVEIDHHIYEFGAVEYHIQSSASDTHHIFLSVSTPLLSQGVYGLPHCTLEAVKGVYSNAVEVVEHARRGYQLTLRIDLTKLPHGKESVKVIKDISSVQAVILSSQLKKMMQDLGSQDISEVMYKPIKLAYYPREPFFVIRMPEKITAVFPMRFRDNSDVIIATAFFQELMDVGSSEAWTKAPFCTWSPIPPPELRGEPFQDLNTNGGFVSFDISSRHTEDAKLEKIVWGLLNFYAYVKYHVKSTRGFIQRRMRTRLESLAEVLHKSRMGEDEQHTRVQGSGFRYIRKLLRYSKSKTLRRKCDALTKKIKRIRSRIRILGFPSFHRRWLRIPKCESFRKYTKLD